jgi:hypothetical protein
VDICDGRLLSSIRFGFYPSTKLWYFIKRFSVR